MHLLKSEVPKLLSAAPVHTVDVKNVMTLGKVAGNRKDRKLRRRLSSELEIGLHVIQRRTRTIAGFVVRIRRAEEETHHVAGFEQIVVQVDDEGVGSGNAQPALNAGPDSAIGYHDVFVGVLGSA